MARLVGRGRGSGFCTVDFLAGAGRTMLREGLGRVAIVDLDAHPGDGTFRLERDNPGVGLFDISGGAWIDVRNDHRVEYHVARSATAYRDALQDLRGLRLTCGAYGSSGHRRHDDQAHLSGPGPAYRRARPATIDVFEELSAELQVHLTGLQQVLTTELAAFNRRLADLGFEPIDVR